MTSLAYREAEAGDLRFIEESFLDSFRTAHAAGLVSMDDWRDVMTPQIRRILERPSVAISVAYHPGAATSTADLYGWLATERGHDLPLVVYCYVKHAYRRMGIMRGLLARHHIDPTEPIYYAAKTGVAAKLARSLFHQATWKPLLLRFPHPTQTDRGSNVTSQQSHRQD